MISISKEEFNKWYPRHQHLWRILTTEPVDEHDFMQNYLTSKLWRLNNLYHIIDKDGDPCVFKMNRAQFYTYSKLFEHPRLIVLKSRQQGISTLFLISYTDDAIFYSNLNCGLMAQDKEAASLLLERTKYLWDKLDPAIKDFLGVRLVKDNTSELTFSNKSSLFIRTSFRSATLHRLHVSELGKIANKYPERAKETKTGTLQALAPGNYGVIESTAEGNNMFKEMWDASMETVNSGRNLAAKDFLPVFLPWLEDPDCVEYEPQEIKPEFEDYFLKTEKDTGLILTPEQKNFWIAQERELEGLIHQEYPATPDEAFSAAKDGTYWARKYLEYIIRRGRCVPNLYDKNLEVYCVMDLGRNDYTVMTLFQVFRDSLRIIYEYYNTGEGLKHYADKFFELQEKFGWDLKEVGLPHDALVKDLSEENNRTREKILNDYGVTNTKVLEKQSVQSGIELVREAMPYIHIDKRCVYLEKCFLNYSKEWNKTLEIWRDEPKKSEYNHGADTIRYMVQYARQRLKFEPFRAKRKAKETAGKQVYSGLAL